MGKGSSIFRNKHTIAIFFILLMMTIIRGSSFIMWLSVEECVMETILTTLKFYTLELVFTCVLLLIFYGVIVSIQKLKLRLFFHILLLLVVAMAFAVGTGFSHYLSKAIVWQGKWELVLSQHVIWYSISQLGTLFALSGVYHFVDNWFQLKKEREKALQATTLAQQARLQMLRYQLNPHFLFNSLNSIRALIDDDQKKARQVVSELSEFLRYSLLNAQDGMVPFGKEIDVINSYFDIQKIRFEEKLKIEMCVDPEVRKIPVPCFLIHPLAENAVKYGMQTSPSPLQIVIKACLLDDNQLEVRVSNTGHLTNGKEQADQSIQQAGTGTGIQNVRQRLLHTYGDHYTFELSESDGWVLAYIKINLQHTL